MDDLVAEILSDKAVQAAIFDVMDRAGAPDYLKALLFSERNIPLRDALHMFPDFDKAVKVMNAALANL